MEDRLWDYIDGLSSPAERSAIEELMTINHEWQEKYRELLNVHQLFEKADLEEPSMRFTKNVMEEISKYAIAPATRSYVNKNIIRGIGAFFLTLIAGMLLFCLRQIQWTSPGATHQPAKDPVATRLDGLSGSLGLEKINWARFLNSSWVIAFMLIVVVMGWMLLDMYLQQKKNAAAQPRP
jgi:hypothetical protein